MVFFESSVIEHGSGSSVPVPTRSQGHLGTLFLRSSMYPLSPLCFLPPPFPWSISLPLYSRSQQCIPPCLSYFLSLVLSLVLCLVTRSSLARQRSCEKGMLGELYASLRPLRQPVPPLDSRRVAGAEDTWSGLSEARSRGRFDGGGSRNLLDGRPRGGLFNADRTTSVACGTS
jgi:hypothetical protein